MIHRLAILTIVTLSCGCTQLALFSWSGPQFAEATAKNPVIDVMCLWEPAEGQGLDGLPCRGFAGQVLFFTAGHPQPAKVEGDIRIYVFDDQGTAAEQAEPLHTFDFNGGSWTAFLQESNIGAAYQLFVPYSRAGQLQADCALRVRFTPRDGGQPIYSRMTSVALPGKRVAETSKQLQPEGNSVPSPLGAATRTESASGLDLPPAVSAQLRQQLSQLQTAAAAASRHIDPPAALPAEVLEAAPLSPPPDTASRRSYKLATPAL